MAWILKRQLIWSFSKNNPYIRLRLSTTGKKIFSTERGLPLVRFRTKKEADAQVDVFLKRDGYRYFYKVDSHTS